MPDTPISLQEKIEDQTLIYKEEVAIFMLLVLTYP